MADDNIDFRFLGQQVKNLQGDVRDMRTDHHRLEGNVAGMRSDITRIEGRIESVEDRLEGVEDRLDRLESKVDNGFRSIDARFDQMAQTATTNLQFVLTAIADIKSPPGRGS